MSVRRSLLAGAIAVVLSGCASYTAETAAIRSQYQSRNYSGALKDVDESSVLKKDRNRLLYRLEKAMILDRMDDHKRSQALLKEADRIADQLYTVSISRTAASLVVSEDQTDYSGEDYERVGIHIQLALSFIGQERYDAALVEARKINNLLKVINDSRGDSPARYKEDAFARYLSGLIYESGRQWDNAIIDYRRAINLYRGDYGGYGTTPRELVKALHRLYIKRNRTVKAKELQKKYPELTKDAASDYRKNPRYGQIAVIHELGNIPVKVNNDFFITVGSQVVRFSFPVLRSESRSFTGRTGFTLNGGKFFSAQAAADMAAIARDSLEDRRGRMIAKQMVRLVAKGQIADQARQRLGPLAGVVANAALTVTETADTRSWTTLPEGYYVSRARVAPGTYKVEVKTSDRVTDIKTVKVGPETTVLLRSR